MLVARPSKNRARGGGSGPTRPRAGGSRTRGAKEAGSRAVIKFVRGLAEKERIALIVRDELFGGSWENMRRDLEARAAGRPYVFKLASRIEDDLKAVRKLRAFERRHKLNLADYLCLEEGR